MTDTNNSIVPARSGNPERRRSLAALSKELREAVLANFQQAARLKADPCSVLVTLLHDAIDGLLRATDAVRCGYGWAPWLSESTRATLNRLRFNDSKVKPDELEQLALYVARQAARPFEPDAIAEAERELEHAIASFAPDEVADIMGEDKARRLLSALLHVAACAARLERVPDFPFRELPHLQ